MKLDVLCFLHWLPWAHFRIPNACNFLIIGQKTQRVGIHFLSYIARTILVIVFRICWNFHFSTPAPMVSVLAVIANYATSSLIWCNVPTCMISFSAKNQPRLKIYIKKRQFSFLEWKCHLFHHVKRENVYFIRGVEICIFSFTWWNKWHIHLKIWISSIYWRVY